MTTQTLIILTVIFLYGCGTESPPAPSPSHVKFIIPVPSTDDIGGACPDGYLAARATIRFWQNGSPKQLELDCVSK